MANPVVVEATRGKRVEFRPSRRRLRSSMRRAALSWLSATLSGRSIHAPRSSRSRRCRWWRAAQRTGSRTPNWRSPAPPIPVSPSMSRLALRCWPRRGGRLRARLRRALATGGRGGAGAGAKRRRAGAAAQQLLGQARGVSLPGLRDRRRAHRICRAPRSRRAARGRRSDRVHHRRPTSSDKTPRRSTAAPSRLTPFR